MRADGWTDVQADMTKLIVAVRSFANGPETVIGSAGGIARSKRDCTRAETRFGLSAKRTSPFKSAGVSVQSTTGSRGVRISGQRLYRLCSDVQSKASGYPLHSHLSPSLPLPCVIVCHQVPNALYNRTGYHVLRSIVRSVQEVGRCSKIHVGCDILLCGKLR